MGERTSLSSDVGERRSRQPAVQRGNRRQNRFCDACHLEVYPTNWMRHQRSRSHREAADYGLDTSSRRRLRLETRSTLSVGPSSSNSIASSDGSPTRAIPRTVTRREMQRCAALVFGSSADTYEEFCDVARRLTPNIPLLVRQCMATAAEMFAAVIHNAARGSSPPRQSSRRVSIDRATNTPWWLLPFRRSNSCPPRISGSPIDASTKVRRETDMVVEAPPPSPPHHVEKPPQLPPPIIELYAQEPETAFGPLFADLTGLDSPFSRVELESSPEKVSHSTVRADDAKRTTASPSGASGRHPDSPSVSSLPNKQPVVALFRIPMKRKSSENSAESQSPSLLVKRKENEIGTPATDTIEQGERRQHAGAGTARTTAPTISAKAEVARTAATSAFTDVRCPRDIGLTSLPPSSPPELPTLDERIAEILGDEPPPITRSATKSTDEVPVVASMVPLQVPKRLPAPPTPWRQPSFPDKRTTNYQSFSRVRIPVAASTSITNEDRSAPETAVGRISANSEASSLSFQQIMQTTVAQANMAGVAIPQAVVEFMSAMNPIFQVPLSPGTASRRSSR